jgi:hypothetical protein
MDMLGTSQAWVLQTKGADLHQPTRRKDQASNYKLSIAV